jgi:hypothetical protein
MLALDDYLDRLGRELQASQEEADEVLREVRSHLELAVRDMGGNGRDEATCLACALERFGTAEHIGRELRQVHGRATWLEAGLAALPLLLFGWLATTVQMPDWVVPLALAAATVLAWRVRWPLWWWAWLGWLPFAVPGLPHELLWGGVAYVVILLLVSRRDWLEATLAIYPLPTAWAFHRMVLISSEIRYVDWSATTLSLLSLVTALVWAALLMRTLRTSSTMARIRKVLEGQVAVFLFNALTVVAARLWPTHPAPYPYTLRYFLFPTLPYAIYNGMPFLLFFVLTSLPAVLALVQQVRARRRPPSRPALGG